MPNQKNFNKLLIFESLYKYAKNEAVLSINSGEIVDLKILESDSLSAIGLYLRKKIFPKYGTFILKQIQWKHVQLQWTPQHLNVEIAD